MLCYVKLKMTDAPAPPTVADMRTEGAAEAELQNDLWILSIGVHEQFANMFMFVYENG